MARSRACQSGRCWRHSRPCGAGRPSIATGSFTMRGLPSPVQLRRRRRRSCSRAEGSTARSCGSLVPSACRVRSRICSGCRFGFRTPTEATGIRTCCWSRPPTTRCSTTSSSRRSMCSSARTPRPFLSRVRRALPRRRPAAARDAAAGWPRRVRPPSHRRFDRPPRIRPGRRARRRALPACRKPAHRPAARARAGRAAFQSMEHRRRDAAGGLVEPRPRPRLQALAAHLAAPAAPRRDPTRRGRPRARAVCEGLARRRRNDPRGRSLRTFCRGKPRRGPAGLPAAGRASPSPRFACASADAAEHHDHRSGLGVDDAPVVALHRRAVRSRGVAERRVRPRHARDRRGARLGQIRVRPEMRRPARHQPAPPRDRARPRSAGRVRRARRETHARFGFTGRPGGRLRRATAAAMAQRCFRGRRAAFEAWLPS